LERQHARQRYDDYDAQRQGLLARAQREREWASQGRSKVAKSDENDKHIRHFKINQTEQLAGKAARTQKSIERLEAVEEPRTAWELRLEIPNSQRGGDVVIEARSAAVRRGSFQLGPVTLSLAHGDRVALVGANGAGKTTLIELLLGRVVPDEGSVRIGPAVKVGEIEQARGQLASGATLLRGFMDAIQSQAVVWSVADSRTLLAKFGLGAEHVNRAVDTLSPGERTRASLALLMATGANLLVLDEPTNHLDIEAIEQLEQALETFAGTVLLVTHDRALLERVHITRTLELVEGSCTERG
jgi:ATPase subunit of ABC transporter with duplicated ATPase domains